MQLDKPEDWKRPHRYCLALYAKQVLEDDFFRENLYFDKEINSKYIYNYTMTSRLKETVLIKKLNLLSEEEKKNSYLYCANGKKIYGLMRIYIMHCLVASIFTIICMIKKNFQIIMKNTIQNFKSSFQTKSGL